MKTCRFRTTSDSATHPTSCQRFFEIHCRWVDFFKKMSNIGRTIPTLTTSPPFPQFLGRKWKWWRADLGLFRIHWHAPPPAGGFSKLIFVVENWRPSCHSSRSYWLPLQKLPTIPFHCNCFGIFFAYTSLTSPENRTTKKLPVKTRFWSIFYLEMGNQQCQKKDHGDTVPQKTRGMFLCSLQINI